MLGQHMARLPLAPFTPKRHLAQNHELRSWLELEEIQTLSTSWQALAQEAITRDTSLTKEKLPFWPLPRVVLPCPSPHRQTGLQRPLTGTLPCCCCLRAQLIFFSGDPLPWIPPAPPPLAVSTDQSGFLWHPRPLS